MLQIHYYKVDFLVVHKYLFILLAIKGYKYLKKFFVSYFLPIIGTVFIVWIFKSSVTNNLEKISKGALELQTSIQPSKTLQVLFISAFNRDNRIKNFDQL